MGNSNHSHKKNKKEPKKGKQTKDIPTEKHQFTKYGRSLSTKLDEQPIQIDQNDGQTADLVLGSDAPQTKQIEGQPAYPMSDRISAFSSPERSNSAEIRSASVQNVLSAGMFQQSSSVFKQGNYGESSKASEKKFHSRRSNQRNKQEPNLGELIKAIDFVTSYSEFHHVTRRVSMLFLRLLCCYFKGEIAGLNEIQGCLGLSVQEAQEEEQQKIQSKIHSSKLQYVDNSDKQPSLYSQFQSRQQLPAPTGSLSGAQEQKQPSVVVQEQKQQAMIGSNLKLNYNYFYNKNNINQQEDISHKNPFSSKEITEDSSFERALTGEVVAHSEQKKQPSSIKSVKEQPKQQEEELNYSQYWKELQKEAAERQAAVEIINNNSIQAGQNNTSSSAVKLLKLSQLRLINQANVQSNIKKLNELKVQQHQQKVQNDQLGQNNSEHQPLSLLEYNRILAAKNKEESRIVHSPSDINAKTEADSDFKISETHFDPSMSKQPILFQRQQTFGRQRSHSETLVKSISSRDFTGENHQISKDNRIEGEDVIGELEVNQNPMVSGKFGFSPTSKMENHKQITNGNALGIAKLTQKQGVISHDLEIIKAETEQKESQDEIKLQDDETQTNLSLRYASHHMFLEKLHRNRLDSKNKDDTISPVKRGIQDELQGEQKQQWNGFFDPMRIGSCRDRSYSEMIGKLKKQYAQQSKWLYASVVNNVKQDSSEGRRSNKSNRSNRSNSQKKLVGQQSEMQFQSQKSLLSSLSKQQQQIMMQNNTKDKEKQYSQMPGVSKANSNNHFKVLKQSSLGVKRIQPGNAEYSKNYQGQKDSQFDFEIQQKNSNNYVKNKGINGNQSENNKGSQVRKNNFILTRSQQAYLPRQTNQSAQTTELEEKAKSNNSESLSSKSADSFEDSQDNESLDPIQISLAVSQFRKASMLQKDN